MYGSVADLVRLGGVPNTEQIRAYIFLTGHVGAFASPVTMKMFFCFVAFVTF